MTSINEHDETRVLSNMVEMFSDLRLFQVFKRVLKEVNKGSGQDNSWYISVRLL